MGLDAPDGPYETVAGLVADLLGRIPVAGDRAELPGWHLTVRRVDRYRAASVRIVRTDQAQAQDPDQNQGLGPDRVAVATASAAPLVAEGAR